MYCCVLFLQISICPLGWIQGYFIQRYGMDFNHHPINFHQYFSPIYRIIFSCSGVDNSWCFSAWCRMESSSIMDAFSRQFSFIKIELTVSFHWQYVFFSVRMRDKSHSRITDIKRFFGHPIRRLFICCWLFTQIHSPTLTHSHDEHPVEAPVCDATLHAWHVWEPGLLIDWMSQASTTIYLVKTDVRVV